MPNRDFAAEQFRDLLEAAPDAMVIVDRDGKIMLVNRQTERLFGYDRSELIGEAVEVLMPDSARAGHAAKRHAYADRPEARPMGAGLELLARRKDGTDFPAEISLSPLHTSDGLLVSAAVRDISDRKRAEEQFRGLLEAAPDAMVIVDRDGKIVLVNRQTERLFGYERAELVGAPVEVLMPEAVRAGHAAKRDAYADRPEVRPMGAGLELLARRRDGTEFPAEISLSPLQTSQGLLVSAAVRDISERRRIEAALTRQTLHDALTGLPNRVLLADRLGRALGRAARAGTPAALLFVDLDRFKLINDSRGHAAGDRLLVAVAERLDWLVRSTDTVARFAGDEFVIVADEGMNATEARLLGERIVEGFIQPFTIDGEDLYVTASVGICLSSPGASVDELLRDADAAMYRAKDLGRARCEIFDATMSGEAELRLAIRNDLHRALERHELGVHYQPIVDLRTGAMVSAEALVRWNHPTQGSLAPLDFIPVAEDSGLIVPVGSSVLHSAARQWAAWGWPDRCVLNVNLSAHQVRHPDLVTDVVKVLHETGLDPTSLCLELTESVLFEDLQSPRQVLHELKDLGVLIAIDDFGTGYSSLTYLKRFPIDIVKIDRSFLAGLGQSDYDSTIVEAIIELVHALGLRATAEGIETAEQQEQLRALGCDLGQGYYLSPPLPADRFAALIARHRWPAGASATVPV
ncbi:MAG TPA: EAL domain-containing protein [Acidimicrobiia bacterium]|nr:EAL domain-containing protein [Acidimicrobiia bacterium]